MWTVSPQELGDYSVRWYYYAAPMAWLIWRYGPQRFAEWTAGNYSSYLLFLLSPWDWGRFLWAREPEYDNCGPWGGRVELKPYTAQYCRDFYYDSGTKVVSDVPVNATIRPPYLLLALAAPAAASGQYTVTPIPPATFTVTQTVTTTATVTQTVTITATQTVTKTETVTTTLVNTTATVPITVTYTVTETAPITVTVTHTTTYTVTETPPGISLDPTTVSVLTALAVSLLIAAVACTRCATNREQTTAR